MAEKASEIFMYFCQEATPLTGECQTELAVRGRPKNELLQGFHSGLMFEISRFQFGVGIEKVENPASKEIEEFYKSSGRPPPRNKPRPKDLPREASEDTAATVHPVTFTRAMDTASSQLLHHTIKCTYFRKVAIVKRKSAGGASAGEAYLRMDFRGVIIAQAGWSNEDPIEESYTLQARAITMRYRPQLEDGTLGASRVGFWSMVPDAREADLS